MCYVCIPLFVNVGRYHRQVMAEMQSKFSEGPDNLEYMMWRSIAMRVAINVLMDQSQYQVSAFCSAYLRCALH